MLRPEPLFKMPGYAISRVFLFKAIYDKEFCDNDQVPSNSLYSIAFIFDKYGVDKRW